MMEASGEDDEDLLFDDDALLTSPVKHAPHLTVHIHSHPRWSRKFFKTTALSAAFLALGLCIAIPGPTLIDLRDRVNTDTKHISYIFTARSVGYLVGSVLGGFLFDRFDQKLLLAVVLLFTSVATFAAPWCQTLILLAVMISFQGISMGVLDTGGNVYCIQIWGKNTGPYMQMLHFFFGVGAFLSPLLAKPFLSPGITTGNFSSADFMNMTDPLPIAHGHIPVMLPDYGGATPDSNSRLLKREIFQYEYKSDSNGTTRAGVLIVTLPGPRTSIPPTPTKDLPKKPVITNGESQNPEFADGGPLRDHLQAHEDEIESNLVGRTPATTLSVPTTTMLGNETEVKDNETSAEELTSTVPTTLLTTPTTMTTTTPTTTVTTPTTTMTTTTHTTPTTTAKPTTRTTAEATTSILSVTPLDTPDSTESNMTYQKPTQTVDELFHETLDALKNMSNIQFAYLIIAAFLFFTCVWFLGLYCYEKNEQTFSQLDTQKDPVTETRGFRVQMLVFLFIFFFLYVGMEVTYGGFILTFAVQHMHWSKEEAALLTAAFWGALAAGRGASICVAKFSRPPVMLIIDLILAVIALLILCFTLKHYAVLLWPGTVLLGLGLSSIFPTGISWAENYMKMTGKATGVLVVGSALGEMSIPVLTGYFFTTMDQMSLMYIMFALSILSVVVFIIMQNLASNRGDRHMRKLVLKLDDIEINEFSPPDEDIDLFDRDVDIKRRVRFKGDSDQVQYQFLKSSEEE